ncbi:hypothetical protein QZH56_33485 [Streptomyces olivoreticuli]|uniref:hypothetical protein n=1 Tax=Streptomyces olivoreticuli TaxID=68246 RepID=UPI00265A5C73|nr:hypothetical protein [Streptomyces olivoreticuli]WKK23569.1 hypothetical protein QZH56_33485 [Streptomyces olivoreticuli]
MARDGSGRLTVVATAPSGLATYFRRQTVPSGGWDGWQALFGWTATAPALALDADGRLEAFALSPGGARLGHRRQVTPGGNWAPDDGFDVPGVRPAAVPTAAVDATGRIHVFAVTTEGRIHTRVQDRPSGDWRPWTTFGDRAIAPAPSGSPAY